MTSVRRLMSVVICWEPAANNVETLTPSCAFEAYSVTMAFRMSFRSKVVMTSFSLPDSIFEMFITSSTMRSSFWLFSCIRLISSFRSSAPSTSGSTLVKPMMAFSGVRISWLMLAMKADFRRSLSSALLRASISADSIALRSSMRMEVPTMYLGSPSSLRAATVA